MEKKYAELSVVSLANTRAALPDGPRVKVLNLLRIAHIRLDKERGTAFSLNRRNGLAACRIYIADDDLRAVSREQKGSCATDPSATTR